MKRIMAIILLAAIFSAFSPFALAMDTLSKPSEGQLIFTDAHNSLDYKADFSLSALTGAFREGDDLRLQFPAARLTLVGFFQPLGEWRSLVFSDGSSISGADFDSEGNYTGSFHSVLDQSKSGQSAKLNANPAAGADVALVRISPYGTEVFMGGEDVWGELRDACIQAAGQLFPLEKPDWNSIIELRFEFTMNSDGSLSPLRAYADFHDGISCKILNPQRVYLSGSLSMQAISEGRAVLDFSNRHGEELLSLDVLCLKDENGALHTQCVCPCCAQTLTDALHYLPCGHYSCSEGFDAAVHALAACQVAGHCISEEGHEKCSNCLEYICDGKDHGAGACEHVHNWMPISLVSSRCTSCGYVYTRK